MAEVKITATEWIKPQNQPAGLPQSGKLKLSVYDWVMRYAAYQRRLLFYASVSSSFDQIIDSLRSSLSQALVSFYPLAARLSVKDSSFILDCNHLSIQFSQAVTDSSVSEVQKSGFAPSNFCDQLCQTPPWPWSQDLPLLFVQVTKFIDGGLSIGIAFSHHISDGVSAWHFFSSWSQVAKLGKILNPPDVSFDFQGLELSVEETTALAESIGFRYKNNHSVASFIPPNQLATKLFKLSKETISKLKQHMKRDHHDQSFSTYEAVCGYFWRQITVARRLAEDQQVQLFVLFNTRERFGGLSKHYFGNAISMGIVSSAAGELISKGAGYAAALVQKMIREFDERKNQAHLNFMNEVIDRGFATAFDFNPAGFSLVVSSPRHPVYDCDFGFEKPIGVTFGTNDLHEGKIFLFPSADDEGGVDVTVVLQPQDLDKVELPW